LCLFNFISFYRRSSECSSITHSGYLFKRSNKPFRTAAAAAGGLPGSRPLSPLAVGGHPPAESGVSAIAASIGDSTEGASSSSAQQPPPPATGPQHLLQAGSSLSVDELRGGGVSSGGAGAEEEDPAIELAAGFFGCDAAQEQRENGDEGDGNGWRSCWGFISARRKAGATRELKDDGAEYARMAPESTPPRVNGASVAAQVQAARMSPFPSAPIPIAPSSAPAISARSPLIVSGERTAIPVPPIPVPRLSGVGNGRHGLPPPQQHSLHRFDSAPASTQHSSGHYSAVGHSHSHRGRGDYSRRESSGDDHVLTDNSSHSGGIHGPPPPDFIDPTDGHIWRAKYCILEDGVLYFYRNAVIGESMEAQVEREQMSVVHAMPPPPGSAMHAFGGASGARARVNTDLSKSPVTGGAHPLLLQSDGAAGSSFCYDSHVIFEKRVALDCVGEVRSAELDYGERSFELLAIEAAEDGPKNEEEEEEDESDESDENDENDGEESVEMGTIEAATEEPSALVPKAKKPKKARRPEDRLILRASSTDEMNEWLFDFHRSLTSFMKEIIDHVGLVSSLGEEAIGAETANGGGLAMAGDLLMHPSSSALVPFQPPMPMLPGVFHPPLQATGAAVPIPVASKPAAASTAKKSSVGAAGVIRSYSPNSAIAKELTLSPGSAVMTHGHGRSGLHRRRIRSIKRVDGHRMSLGLSRSPASTPGGGSSPVLSKSLGDINFRYERTMLVDRSRARSNRAEMAVDVMLKREIEADLRDEEMEEPTLPLTVPLPPPPPLTGGRAEANKREETGIGAALVGPPEPKRETLEFESEEALAETQGEVIIDEVVPTKPAAPVEPVEPPKPKPKPISAGKYIPPHLRKKDAEGGGLGGGGKYIPPHLRNKGSRPPPPPPPPCEPDESDENEEKKGSTEEPENDSKDDDRSCVPAHFNRGGCADPKHAVGSILEPMYIPKKKSKIGKFHTTGFGALGGGASRGKKSGSSSDSDSTGGAVSSSTLKRKKKQLLWEVGAISQCGIRESNEDSYLITNDLLGAFSSHSKSSSSGASSSEVGTNLDLNGSERKDSELTDREEGDQEDKDSEEHHHSLFAIFDGHCGNHAARFAAEKLPFYLMEEFENLPPPCGADRTEKEEDDEAISPGSSPERRAEQALTSAIARLDEDFCHLCQADGREWDCGATALIVLVVGDALVVANVGDSRGVLCKSSAPLSSGDDGSGDDHSVIRENGSRSVAHPEDVSSENGWETLELDKDVPPGSGAAADRDRGAKDHAPVYFRVVTPVHSPARPDEKKRIERANGWITTETEIPIKVQLQRMDFYDRDVVDILKRCFADRLRDHNHHGYGAVHDGPKKCSEPGRLLLISRICGELAVSRALGDRDFKAAFNSTSASDVDDKKEENDGDGDALVSDSGMWECPFLLPYPDNHCRQFDGDLVSGIPEIKVMRVGGSGILEEFLLLACDGLWDVMDADDAVRVTRGLLFDKRWSAKKAVSFLCSIFLNMKCVCLRSLNLFHSFILHRLHGSRNWQFISVLQTMSP